MSRIVDLAKVEKGLRIGFKDLHPLNLRKIPLLDIKTSPFKIENGRLGQ